MDEREQRDREINLALESIDRLIKGNETENELKNETEIKQNEIGDGENIDDIIILVKSIDVEEAIRKGKGASFVNLEERTDFAAQLDEIESRVDDARAEEVEDEENDIRLDPRMPTEGRERFLKARCRVMQDEINRLQKELQNSNEKFHSHRRKNQEKDEHINRIEKQNEKQRKELDKARLVIEKETSKAAESEKRFRELKREFDETRIKNKKTKNNQNDVRLQRALDEIQKHKNELAEALRKNREIGEIKKSEFTEIEKEKNKSKKINSELKTIIQKQSKLVEVLRKKCAHLEAARVLEFTEQEFMKTLDWQNE
jgi:hypothetical protein